MIPREFNRDNSDFSSFVGVWDVPSANWALGATVDSIADVFEPEPYGFRAV